MSDPFCFVRNCENLVSAATTVALRPFINGIVPAFVINGDGPCCGKTILANWLGGSAFYPMNLSSGREADRARALQAFAFSSKPGAVGVFDAVDQAFMHSPSVARFITAPVHHGRRLHSQKTSSVENRQTVIITGDYLVADEDMKRRVVDIPLRRMKRFPKRHKLPEFWRFVGPFLDNWRRAGCPLGESRPMPGFEAWSSLISGVLESNLPTKGVRK